MSQSNRRNLILIVTALIVAGCLRESAAQDQAPEVELRVRFDPDPPLVGEGSIFVELADGSGQSLEGLELDIKGDMTHAGMTPQFGASIDLGGGIYEVPFSWSMGGDWILQISAHLPDGRLIMRTINVRVSPE